MQKPTSRVLWLALGVVLVVGLVLLRRGERPESAPSASRSPSPAAPTAPAGPASPPSAAVPNPAMRDLVARLEAILRGEEARAREALLTFKDDAALQRFLQRAERAGLTVVGQLPGLRTLRVRHRNLSNLQDELLANADDYADVSANFLVSVPSVPAREDRATAELVPFGNRTLEYLSTGSRSPEHAQWGRGATIAILDTGVAADATFGTGRLSALDVGLGLVPGTSREAGHGTAVAALAAGLAADATGVAPAANLLSIRVTDASGLSDLFTLSQAIVAAVDAGAGIINVSLGGYGTAPLLNAAIGYATQHGAVIVAAAGNDQSAQLTWPAADPRVISVGAIDAAEQQVTFSNSSQQLQLTAPGYGVQSAWLNGQRVSINGTSASAPLVAGAIAAVMSQNPGLTPAQAAQVLIQTASDAGAPGADPAFGHGILNLNWALNRNRTGYVDTAVASHFYDDARNHMQFVIQNRGAQAVSGLTLNVTAGTNSSAYAVPNLVPGETYLARVLVNEVALKSSGAIPFTTQLVNPASVVDAVPANNRKSSVLTASGKQ